MNKLHLDFESRSELDLTAVGAWAYASHPSTDLICMGFALNDEKGTKQIHPVSPARIREKWGYPPSARVIENAHVVAHNVQFEYAIYHFILHKRFGWPALLDPSKWTCTMARALTCGLPASLEGAAWATKIKFQKDMEGKAALNKICSPRKDGTFNEDPALYERVYQYNGVDVETERELDRVLPELTPEERKVFELNLVINRRGLAIDVRSCENAIEIAGVITKDLNQKLHDMTGGAVSGATKLPAMKMWIAAQGVPIPTKPSKKPDENGMFPDKETLDIEAVKDMAADPTCPPLVLEALRVRQQVGKSSLKKYDKMLECRCADDRIRGTFQYHGAHTGREAGRLNQPTNYPQGLVGAEQEQAIALLNEGLGIFKAVYNSKSMQTLSDCLRGMIVPAAGKVFLGADYNAIECRVLNWLAGETWVLDLFARGESPYVAMATGIYEKQGISKKGTPVEYDIGKRSELGCGFGMGWARFQANVYTETSKRGDGVELSDDLAQKAVKVYRSTHRKVVEFWYAMEAAAVNAVLNPGTLHTVADGRVTWGMSKDRKFLVCRLPSGRLLRYYRPEVKAELDRFERQKNVLYYWTSAGEGAIRTDCNGFLGLYRTWGGELVENVVQAAARDLMFNGALAVEAAGYPLVLTTYDEVLAEVAWDAAGLPGDIEIKNLIDKMCQLPPWAKGCPIAAEGYASRRYRK